MRLIRDKKVGTDLTPADVFKNNAEDMLLKSIRLIYFSPTGTTKKVVEAIARGIGGEICDSFDLTPARTRRYNNRNADQDLAIIGVPVYTGRVPFPAVEVLQRIEAHGTPAVIVVVYGNRAYEDALLELSDIVCRRGFVPIAGAAFIGEHSFSTTATPIAAGRPDSADLEKATEFGKSVRAKLDAFGAIREAPRLRLPGNYPYRERGQHIASPETAMELCIRCSTCAGVCPENAVLVTDNSVTSDKEKCILCCACVKSCPTGARRLEDLELRSIAELLSSTCNEPKDPELFIK